MWEMSQSGSLRMGLGFRFAFLLVLTHHNLMQVILVFYRSAAQPKNTLLFLPSFLPDGFDCCKSKGRNTNSTKFQYLSYS